MKQQIYLFNVVVVVVSVVCVVQIHYPPPPPELSPGVHNDVVIPIVYVTRHSSGCRLPYFRRRVTRATKTRKPTNKNPTPYINDERDIPYT